MFHHIRAYRWNDFPLIMILNYKTWKNSHSIFHLLHFALPNSTYYAIKGAKMENHGYATLQYQPRHGWDITYNNLTTLTILKYEH
jgi:hypothetical protein